jgi:hypothetical protein
MPVKKEPGAFLPLCKLLKREHGQTPAVFDLDESHSPKRPALPAADTSTADETIQLMDNWILEVRKSKLTRFKDFIKSL